MSTLFTAMLVLHVMTGLAGVISNYGTLLTLLKKEVSTKKFFIIAFIAWVSYVISWVSGGYYYWFYYGDKVKPVIKAGEYVWAHNVIMEAKEHIFLMLPLLSLVIMLIAWSSTDRINTDSTFKSAVIYLVSVTTVLAVIIALSGIIISGAAR